MTGRGTLVEVRDESGYPRRGLGRVGGTTGMSGTDQQTLRRYGMGRGPSGRFETGLDTVRVGWLKRGGQGWVGGPSSRSGTVWGSSLGFRMGWGT